MTADAHHDPPLERDAPCSWCGGTVVASWSRLRPGPLGPRWVTYWHCPACRTGYPERAPDPLARGLALLMSTPPGDVPGLLSDETFDGEGLEDWLKRGEDH